MLSSGDGRPNAVNDEGPEDPADARFQNQRHGEEAMRLFEEMVTAIGDGTNWDDTSWCPTLRHVEAEASGSNSAAAPAGDVIEDEDHDAHHKRAKVHAGPM